MNLIIIFIFLGLISSGMCLFEIRTDSSNKSLLSKILAIVMFFMLGIILVPLSLGTLIGKTHEIINRKLK